MATLPQEVKGSKRKLCGVMLGNNFSHWLWLSVPNWLSPSSQHPGFFCTWRSDLPTFLNNVCKMAIIIFLWLVEHTKPLRFWPDNNLTSDSKIQNILYTYILHHSAYNKFSWLKVQEIWVIISLFATGQPYFCITFSLQCSYICRNYQK